MPNMGFRSWGLHSLLAFTTLSGAFAKTPSVPLPSYTADGTDYSEVIKLAAKLAEPRPFEPEPFVPQTYPITHHDKRAGGSRVLIVGDSMSQGKEGDWTWRYRIWQWAQANNLGWNFVGPYTGTRNQPPTGPPQPGPLYGTKRPSTGIPATGGYAAGVDPGFNGAHFAVWGRAMTQDVFEIHDVVAAHSPDIMLVMLGFNDLGWFYTDADGLLRNLGKFLAYARAANPNVKVALANVPQRKSLGREDLPRETSKYNQLLIDNLSSLSTAQSPVYLVHLQENYNCGLDSCPAGYDGLHPNANGEYHIAQAFSNTLVKDMKIGNAPITIPANVPGRPVPLPTNFRVQTSPQGYTATWDPIYGTYGYNVKTRIPGLTDWTMGHTDEYRYDSHWSLRNSTYEIQIQAACGDRCAGPWTSVLSAKAMPQTAEPPQNVHISTSGSSLTLAWDAAVGDYSGSVSQYDVIWWDLSVPCSWISGGAFQSSPATITDLVPGHLYFLAISSWNENGEGFPALLSNVIIGQGTPGAPGGLSVGAIDATTAHITWDPVPGAAGYRLWTRNVNNASSVSTRQKGSRADPCADDGLLFPGVWNYEFCVEAFNGDQNSPKSNCLTAPHPAKGAAVPSCASNPRQSTGCGFGAVPTFSDGPTTANPGPTSTSTPIHDQPGPTTTTTTQKPYQTFTCSDPNVQNANRQNADLSTYWDDLDCTDAWVDVEEAWEKDAPHSSTYQFTQEMANTFGQDAPNWNCQNLTFNGPTNCKVPISCNTVTSPAGWFIMNSIVGLEGIISSVAGTLTISSTYASEQASALVSAFGNLDDGKLSSILSIVSIGMGVLGTPMFGDLIKELNTARLVTLGPTLAGAKDAATNLAGQSIAVVNQGLSSNSAFSEQNSLEVQIATIIGTWQQALTDFNSQLFSGSPDQITQILHYIIDGTMFAGGAVPTLTEKTWLDRALYPLLINYLWGLGHAPVFLMDVGEPCNADKPAKAPISGNKTETYHCVNGKSYYLASANGSPYVPSGCNPRNPHMDCANADFSEPPGLGTLIPGNKWGGVLPEDFATGSVQTWLKNGQKNGVDNSPSFASDIVGQIYDLYSNPNAIYQIPGYFNLPVCTADEARASWKAVWVAGDKRGPNYPCN